MRSLVPSRFATRKSTRCEKSGLAVMAAGNGNRAPRIQLGADQQGAAPFATRNGLDGVGWLLSEKLVTIHDAVFIGAGRALR